MNSLTNVRKRSNKFPEISKLTALAVIVLAKLGELFVLAAYLNAETCDLAQTY